MILLLIPAAALVVALGMLVGWRWVLAPLLALLLLRWLLGSLRALVTDARNLTVEEHEAQAAAPVTSDERTLYWCEECGTELLLLVRGVARAPSHCGQKMHERTEIMQ